MPPSNPNAPSKDGQRIAKLLARAGIASRREIERMIADGRVALHGKTLDTPATVLPSLEGVTVDGNPVEAPEPARLFRYHKPSGLLTTERDPLDRPTIYDRLPSGLPRVMPVGRLDLATEGLLLLTTDGELKRLLELPASGVERSYRARAYGHVTQAQLEDLMLGIEIEGVRYGSINANIERRTGANLWIEMTLTEGKNREVRRVLEYLGLQVSRLIRTRYGPFWLGDLPPGDVDEIRQSDLNTFRTVLAKPGGGKAASNLQFAVRARAETRPRPEPVQTGRPVRSSQQRHEPARSFPTSARPPRSGVDAPRQPRPVGVDQRPQRADAARPARTPEGPRPVKRFYDAPDKPRAGTDAPRPARPGAGGPRAARPNDARTSKEQPRFTPRVTPGRSPDRAERPVRDDTVAKPARAARARAHRETQEPRPGTITARPTKPTKGPAGGRGKPSRPGGKPGKPARPPRTRK